MKNMAYPAREVWSFAETVRRAPEPAHIVSSYQTASRFLVQHARLSAKMSVMELAEAVGGAVVVIKGVEAGQPIPSHLAAKLEEVLQIVLLK